MSSINNLVGSKLYEEFHKTTSIQKKIIKGNNFTYIRIIQMLDKYLFSDKSMRKVLDIGCGAGTLAFYVASKGSKVIGIDISKNAIKASKKSAIYLKLKNTKFAVVNFPSKFPKDKFDFIICCEVIEHLKNDNLALERIYQMLKKGGKAFISTPSKNAPLYKLGLADDFDKRVGHLRRYTTEELVKKCKKNGFIILETKKNEGILRNFLFINQFAGNLIRFIKFSISDIITLLDDGSLKLFGESNVFIVVKKP